MIAHLDVSNGRIDGTIVAWRRSARRRCLQRNRGTVEIVECERTFAKLEDDLSWQGRMEKLMVAQQEAAAARMKAIEEQKIAAAQLMMVQQEATVERMKAAETTVTRRRLSNG